MYSKIKTSKTKKQDILKKGCKNYRCYLNLTLNLLSPHTTRIKVFVILPRFTKNINIEKLYDYFT